MPHKVRIALDAMGGDHGASVVVPGAEVALDRHPDVEFVLFGDRTVVEPLLASRKVVAPVDVLIGIGLLTPAKLEDWRFGRVPYLEKVIDGNLAKLSRVLRILRFHAHDLNLRPSTTAYMRWGKGPKQRLRFTKTADRKLEEAYSLHFIRPGNGRDEVEEGDDDEGISL